MCIYSMILLILFLNSRASRLTLRERNQQFVERYTDASFLVEPLSTVLIEEHFFDVKQTSLPTDLDRLLEGYSPMNFYLDSGKRC